LWLDEGSWWEWWVVLVGVDAGFLLAGLDCELGSVLQEFLGGTAAESLGALWSWLLSCILGLGWEGTDSVGGHISTGVESRGSSI